ncbi:MAG: penicillin-insensitive murein endopeptidase [Neomegalonema sp.]|nr:penicillin-insensitive murein endopeptidase [Neomegalonema sp.]
MKAAGWIGVGIGALVIALGAPAQAQVDKRVAKEVFGRAAGPAAGQSRAFGGYAKGCLMGAAQLAATGPGWQAMRLSRDRRYGHPALIAFIKRLSVKAVKVGWGQLLVGDLAQAAGGPMLTGHASHQIGLDADIWLMPAPKPNLTRRDRERLSARSVVAADRRSVNKRWTPVHPLLLRAAADDAVVARIFVNPAIKRKLCREERAAGANTAWLRKIRPWWGHSAHFHVRLHCPADSPGCTPQAPPPPGDGCDEVEKWLTDEALAPKPRKKRRKPRRQLTVADLPQACRAIAERLKRR